MLVALHPDVARLRKHFKRWHHHVKYGGFKQRLIPIADGSSQRPVDPEYGMRRVRSKRTGGTMARRL